MIPADRLLRIANEAEISTDTMGSVFTLEPLSVPVFPLDTLTNTEKFKIQLSWSPAVIEPGKAVKFIFNIRDPKNDETLTNSYYEFVLLQNGREIYRNSKIAVIGAEVEQFTFTEKHVGTVIVRLENINRTGEFTEYVISVVPEFPISMLVLVASLTLATLLAAQRYNAKP
jgi:predicted secreted protein with PEFG-CTERM motif